MLIMGYTVFARTLTIDFDITQFKATDGKVLLDFTYMIPDTALRFDYIKDGVYHADARFDLTIVNNTGDTLVADWSMPMRMRDYNGKHKLNFFGKSSVPLKPGQYLMILEVTDINDTTAAAKSEFDYIVKAGETEEPYISDAQLAHKIDKLNKKNTDNYNRVFKKNGYYVLPNPACNFSDASTEGIPVYQEIYNGKKYFKEGMTLVFEILDNRKEVTDSYEVTVKTPGDAAVHIEHIPMVEKPTGAYYLNTYLKYPAGSPVNRTKDNLQKFYYYNSKIPPKQNMFFIENVSFEKSEFAVLAAEDVDDWIQKSLIIARESEIQVWETIKDTSGTLKARQRFLYSFWTGRDEDTTTAVNETLMEFRERVEYADLRYSVGELEGWKTDRGKIILKYGVPAQIEDFNEFNDDKEYEIWEYDNLYTGSYFVFVEVNEIQMKKLVHSNVPGEIYDASWREYYLRGSTFDAPYNGEPDPFGF